jgi:hypothetical protein
MREHTNHVQAFLRKQTLNTRRVQKVALADQCLSASKIEFVVSSSGTFLHQQSSPTLPPPLSLSDACRISHEACRRLNVRCRVQAHICDSELCLTPSALDSRQCEPAPAPVAPVLQTLLRRCCLQAQEEPLSCLPMGVESHLPVGYCWPRLHCLFHLRKPNTRRPTAARPVQEDARNPWYVAAVT